jgi:hypothetical protein
VVGVVAYAVLMFIGSLFMSLTWRFPTHEGQVFPGVAALATSVTAANALWVVLLVVEGVACLTNRARPDRRRIVALLAALGLLAMLQWWAEIVRDASSW